MSGAAPLSAHRAVPLASRARRYMVLATVASVVVTAAVAYAAWTAYTVNVRTGELAAQVAALGKGLAAGGVRDAAESPQAASLRDRLMRVQAGLIGASLALTDSNGDVERSWGPVRRDSYPLESFGQADARGVRTIQLTLPRTGRVLMVAAPAGEGRSLVAVQAVREIGRARGAAAGLGAAAIALAAAVAWVLGGLLASRLAAPLGRLRSGAEAVAAGDWGHQVPEEGEEEVAALARSFNGMSARVAAAYEAQRSFVGDVSHELKTPITSIQGFSQALLDGTVTDTGQARRHVGIIHEEALRLGELASTLLALADLDSGRVRVKCEPIDATTLADALLARHAGVAAQRGIELEIAIAGSPAGDPDRLLQAASALLDNALAYTPPAGRVRVGGATGRTGAWVLAVEDSGPGVPQEARETVFERFARLDPSRAKHLGGSGLGLAIVKRLVELMGGTVRAGASADLGGASFVVELPAWNSTWTQHGVNPRPTVAADTSGEAEDGRQERMREVAP